MAIVPEGERARRMKGVEAIIRDWLSDPDIALICGDWRNGSIMELLPETGVTLTSEKYPEPFSGLRDIRLHGQPHHLHLDLAKIRCAVYAVAPSVCYGFKPSFEVRFSSSADDDGAAFACALRKPYVGTRIERTAVGTYFERMFDHARRWPDLVSFRLDRGEEIQNQTRDAWKEAYQCLLDACGEPTDFEDLIGSDALASGVSSLSQEAGHG